MVKLFTIILATSAAGSWWFREELFYREQIRKELPSILQNEIAYIYAERVRINSHMHGRYRMVVDTPDEVIQVIRKAYIDDAFWQQERKKKGVKLHRVRKGESLWTIVSRYLEDPNRYAELAENNRVHDSRMLRPGDVVKIRFKTPLTK